MEGWTMILVRSEVGREYLDKAVEAGVLELRPAEEEPKALEVMDRLARKQRERVEAVGSARVGALADGTDAGRSARAEEAAELLD